MFTLGSMWNPLIYEQAEMGYICFPPLVCESLPLRWCSDPAGRKSRPEAVDMNQPVHSLGPVWESSEPSHLEPVLPVPVLPAPSPVDRSEVMEQETGREIISPHPVYCSGQLSAAYYHSHAAQQNNAVEIAGLVSFLS